MFVLSSFLLCNDLILLKNKRKEGSSGNFPIITSRTRKPRVKDPSRSVVVSFPWDAFGASYSHEAAAWSRCTSYSY